MVKFTIFKRLYGNFYHNEALIVVKNHYFWYFFENPS